MSRQLDRYNGAVISLDCSGVNLGVEIVRGPVQSFRATSISHIIEYQGDQYSIEAYNLDWLHGGDATFADLAISAPQQWRVVCSTVMMTHSNRIMERTDELIGAFARHGYVVKRDFIRACIFPLQMQIRSIEERLKNF